MKSFLFVLILTTLSTAVQATDIEESCAAVHMDCSYDGRYNVIDTIYKATKKALFDKSSNPYFWDVKNEARLALNAKPPRFYIAIFTQNQKLARNIVANKQLFENGKLSLTAAKQWHFVN